MVTKPRSQTNKKPRWHQVYFLLAAFDILTVSGSLYLSHEVMSIYKHSVDNNLEWAQRNEEYSELANLAMKVNAPGNDVFDSHDVSGEQVRRKIALERFNKKMNSTWSDMANISDPALTLSIKESLDSIQLAMNEMVAEADLIFNYFQENNAESAGKRMATMDRKYARLTSNISALNQRVRDDQKLHLNDEIGKAKYLRQFEIYIGGMILIMVIAVTIYGNLIARRFRENEIEKDKLLSHLKNSNRELEAFTTIASHDLKEPLRKIRIFSSRIGNFQDLNEKARYHLERIEHSAERMQNLIDDLFKLARISQMEKEIGMVDLQELMKDVLADLEGSIQTSNGRVHIESLPVLQADPVQMRQLFQNLIANSLKYMKPNKTPEIHINYLQNENGFFEITIQDNGIGMDQIYSQKIFEPFERLHGKTEFEGTGMGLAICKKIVEGHGGMIHMDSLPNVGSTFTVYLPAIQTPAPFQ